MRIGHCAVHQSQPNDALEVEKAAEPVADDRAEDEEPEREREGDGEAREHSERRQPLPQKAPRLLAVVDAVEPAHEGVHRARGRPERQHEPEDDEDDPAALVLGHARQALADELDRLGRDDVVEAVEHRLDRVRPRRLREDADGYEEHRGDGEECVVGERGGDVRDRVVPRLL